MENVTLGQTFLQEFYFSIPLIPHTHYLLYRQSNMNIAIDSIVQQDIYIVIITIEDKFLGGNNKLCCWVFWSSKMLRHFSCF